MIPDRDTLKVELHLENGVTITMHCDGYEVPGLIAQLRASRVLRAEVTAIAPPPRPEPVVEKFPVGERRQKVSRGRTVADRRGHYIRSFGDDRRQLIRRGSDISKLYQSDRRKA